MQILHGTWIPEATDDFVQQGGFYLWVETEQLRRWKDDRHRRHLPQPELAEFLHESLGFRVSPHRELKEFIEPCYFLLPTADGLPLPSLELSRYLEAELPEKFDWQYWKVDCYRVGSYSKGSKDYRDRTAYLFQLLPELHFLAQHNLAEIQLGADLLFWYYYCQSFKSVILKDQYIPALRYRDLTQPSPSDSKRTHARRASSKQTSSKQAQAKRTQSKQAKGWKTELYPSWEIISQGYETALQEALDYMPLSCAAGFAEVSEKPQLHEQELLLRHFSESLLHKLARDLGRSLPASFLKKIEGSLLEQCLRSDRPITANVAPEQLETYQQWQTWRDRISRTQTELPFHLYFVLQDPQEPEQPWQLLFQVAPKQDPSLQITLLDYWRLRPNQQAEFNRQFGEDFEQHLLLNLGYAARIYPKLWEALDTDQPMGIVLDLDAAFGFLQESAWVLEDAGYKVIVPAWWTPEGRRRAKIKLRANSKAMGSGDPAKSYFSFDKLIQYQYELSIGDERVSRQEWEQLVEAKTPLVHFRGQWMQLDQSKMREMLVFWEEHKKTDPELSLMAFMKLTAEGGDEIEVDYSRDQALSDMLSKLGDRNQLELTDNPKGFHGNLREYQKRGLSWLNYLEGLGLNGCLADDMGLGKTVQVIARLLQERESEKLADDQSKQGKSESRRKSTPKKSTQKTTQKTVRKTTKAAAKTAAKTTKVKTTKTETAKTETVKAETAKTEASVPQSVPPTLLIAPTSVVGNWLREIKKFGPSLKAIVHHGAGRTTDKKAFQQTLQDIDIVITSFTLARKDAKLFQSLVWQRVVLDEAQNIKNPKAAQTKAILKLEARHRLALTGTPVENRLLDLWSIFNFLNPGYLGKENQFRRNFERPVQRYNDPTKAKILQQLVEPFILRRVKTDESIIKDLPDKVEQKLYCNLTKEQASLYEATVKDIEKSMKGLDGIKRKGVMLSALMKLKQICNHPAQFLHDGSEFTEARSHKLQRLTEMTAEVMAEGESMLIFTQFREIGDALEQYFRQECYYNTYYIHGGTSRKRREQMIAEFQDLETEPSIFILSLKAGGVGITLTKANHVFHFDRWWNPAVEDQATDRAFRIGQQKNVFVHKFVAIGTLEERIDQMIEDKKKLADAVVGSDESWLTELDNDAFRRLISLNKSAVLD